MRYTLCVVMATACLVAAGVALYDTRPLLALWYGVGYCAWMINADPPEDMK